MEKRGGIEMMSQGRDSRRRRGSKWTSLKKREDDSNGETAARGQVQKRNPAVWTG